MTDTRTISGLIASPQSVLEDYWNSRVAELKSQVDEEMEKNEGKCDITLRNLYELTELAVSHEQYCKPVEDYEPVTRVAKIRIQMPRKSIEDCFHIKTVSLYGVGLYAPVEGLLVPEHIRRRTNYDMVMAGKKNAVFDLSFIPQELQQEYEFRLAVPALNGLFVPKRCEMTGYMRSHKQIQYFDIMI